MYWLYLSTYFSLNVVANLKRFLDRCLYVTVTSELWYILRLKRIDLTTYVIKVDLLFFLTHPLKTPDLSWSDLWYCASEVNKTFGLLEKLTHHSSDRTGLMGRVSGRGWLISRGWTKRYKWYQSWLAISVLTRKASWDLSWSTMKTLRSLRGVNCNIPSCDIWKSLRELIWLPMSPKLTYFFCPTSVKNSGVKRAWAGIVKWYVTYRKVICNIVQVRPKHGKMSSGDCMISKLNAGVDCPLVVGGYVTVILIILALPCPGIVSSSKTIHRPP